MHNKTKFHLVTALLVALPLALALTPSARAAGTWAQIVNAPPAGLNNSLVLLDGTIICGDGGSGWYRFTPDSHGSYHNGTWAAMAASHYSRLFYSSQILTNGNLYVAGGEYGTGTKHAELYNTLNNSWSDIAQPAGDPTYSDAVSKLLPGGNVLQGTTGGGVWFYNAALNTISGTASAGNQNEACWVKLTNDCVMTVIAFGTSSQHYNPASSSWVTDPTVPVSLYGYGGEMGAGLVLPNGKVFYIGGTPHTAIYTCGATAASAGSWVAGPDMIFGTNSYGAVDAPAAMMVNGKILCGLGVTNGFGSVENFFEYDYVANAFTQVNGPTGVGYGTAPFATTMTALPDGTIWFIGGQGSTSVYIYTPDLTPLAAGQPVINTITENSDGSYHLTGTGLNGITGGGAYGDDWQMDSDYPQVRMTNTTSSLVYYARTYNRNSTSIMTGSKVLATEFALPAGLPAGTYSLVVSANGNASAATNFTYAPLAAPTGLRALIGSAQMKLSWNAVSNAINYDVKRASAPNGYFATVATVPGTGFTNNSLNNGVTYYYAVSAVGSGGPSPDSTNLIVTPFGTPPTPSGLTAGALSFLAVSLDWNPTNPAASYNVKRGTTSGGPYTTIANRVATDFTDTNVVSGTKYYYVVSSVNTAGESVNSPQAFATPFSLGDVTNGLVGNWTFDDTLNPTPNDFSGNNNVGTLANNTNTAWITPGRIGASSLYFDTNLFQSVTVGSAASLNMTAGITISAWVLPVDWNLNRRILQKGDSDNQYRFLSEGGVLKFHLNGVNTLTCGLPPTNIWTHLAATWDGAAMTIYSNGISVASVAASGAIVTSSSLLAIGKKNTSLNTVDYFYGQLDEVRLYNRGLSAAEINTVMHSGETTLATPTGVIAYAGNTRASLIWAPASAASSYNVKRATTSGGPYTTIATSLTASYSDFGLTNGTTYFYVVSALNSTNESANSSQVSALVNVGVSFFADINYSGVGSSLLGAGNFSSLTGTGIANDSSSSCRIPNGWTVTIYQNSSFGGGSWFLNSDTPDFSVISGLNNNISSFKITAGTAPATPTGLTTTNGNALVSLAWRPSTGASSYNLKRSTTNGGPYIPLVSTEATNFTDTGLINGTNYYYVVSAISTNGESAYSSAVTGTPFPPPSTPTGLVALPSNAQVNLSWNTASGATRYNVKRSTTSGSSYTIISTPAVTNYNDTGVTNGITYYYVVSGTNGAGESANSSEANATPLAQPPIPTGLTAIPGNTQISLSWDPSSAAFGYNVKRSTTSGSGYAIVATPSGTNYTDLGLTNGTPYYYVVSATNTLFQSADSLEATATPVAGPITLAIGPLTNGQFTLQFSGVDGHTYIVQTSTNLLDWSPVFTNQQSGGAFSYTDTNATDLARFYRVQQ